MPFLRRTLIQIKCRAGLRLLMQSGWWTAESSGSFVTVS